MASAARRPLTVRTIDAMAVGEIIWDGAVRGLYVTYRREGHAKRYALKVRILGRPRHIAIGAHGSPWTPDLARKEANRLLGQIAQGQDPAGDREIARATLTVRDVALRFLAEHCGVTNIDAKPFVHQPGASIKPKTAQDYVSTLRTHVLMQLGKLRVDTVTVSDLAKRHHDMRASPRAANLMLATVSSMVNWAMTRGLWPKGSNPTVDIKRFKERRRWSPRGGRER